MRYDEVIVEARQLSYLFSYADGSLVPGWSAEAERDYLLEVDDDHDHEGR